jgi:thiamine-phosphate pyrophosphorylase
MKCHIPKIYYFISELNPNFLENLKKNTALIYRNYNKKPNIKELINFKKLCKKKNTPFYLSNYPKIAVKINLDGAYIPSFNKNINLFPYIKKIFLVLGSAHTIPQIKIKEKQKVDCIFISPLFLTKKLNRFLGLSNFKKLSISTKKKVIALGGLKKSNLNRIKILNIHGYASISLFKKN